MSLALTQEQDDLRESIRKYLDAQVPLSRVREVMELPEPHEPAWWTAFADTGIHGLAVPERFGGHGVDLTTLALVFEETGRSLVPGPLLATLGLGCGALLASDDEQACSRYLPEISAGRSIATLAFLAPGGGWDDLGTAGTAREGADGWRIDGRYVGVFDGMTADLCLMLADTDRGTSLFAVSTSAPGVRRTPVNALDRTRGLAELTLQDTPAEPVGALGAGAQIFRAARDQASVLLAAEMVGSAQACLDMAVAYAKERVQFGRPIGSFQAIKHKCAEVRVALDGARSCARYAAWAADHSVAELPTVAPLAKAAAADAFFLAAAENLQIHGGIGFTWEHDAHLYLKRAKVTQLMLGDSRTFRLRLADQIGIGPVAAASV